MIISIASGKGGTGKTSIAVNLAFSLSNLENNVYFYDCDVEEPNSHIFLKPKIADKKRVNQFFPSLNPDLCKYCGKCAELCNFNAIAVIKPNKRINGKWMLFDHLCHGCGLCIYFCPYNALKEKERPIGVIRYGKTDNIYFCDGNLIVGESIAPPIIKEMKKSMPNNETVIIDSPPGTTCPMVETVRNTDFCLLVTEPTPFGLHDLKLAIEVLENLKIPFGVAENKSDKHNKLIKNYCKEMNIPILLEIPFDREIAKIYSEGKILVKEKPEYENQFINLFNEIKEVLKK